MKKKIVVRHFHEGNDVSREIRGPATYATQARVVDLETGETVIDPDIKVHAATWAFCNPKDTPSRRIGREVTLGRLRRMFPAAVEGADWGKLPEAPTKN